MAQTKITTNKLNKKLLIIIFAVLFAAIGGLVILRSKAATLFNQEVVTISDATVAVRNNGKIKTVDDFVVSVNSNKQTKVVVLQPGEAANFMPYKGPDKSNPTKTCYIVNAVFGKTDVTAQITSGAAKRQVTIKPYSNYQNICVAYKAGDSGLSYDIKNNSAPGGVLKVYQVIYYGNAIDILDQTPRG